MVSALSSIHFPVEIVKPFLRPGIPQILLGLLLFIFGLVLNPWFLGKIFSPDGHIGSWISNALIFLLEAHLLVLGGAFLRMRQRFPWRNLSLSIGIYALGLVGFFCYDFYRGYYNFFTTFSSEDVMSRFHQADPKMGWRPIPNARGRHFLKDTFDVIYEMDENGFKKVPSHPQADLQIFFFGDSFTFGHGVPNAQTFPNILSEHYFNTRVNVYNLGVMGYGFLQMYRRYLSVESRIQKGDLVIFSPISADLDRGGTFFLLLMRDHFSLLDHWRNGSFPYFRDGEVQDCPLKKLPCLVNMLVDNTPYSSHFLIPLKRKLGLTPDQEARAIVKILKKRVEQKGAHFLLTFLPMGMEVSQAVYEYSVEGFDFQDLLPYLKDYQTKAERLEYSEDGHYNPYGNRVMAQGLARMFWDRHLVPQDHFRQDPHHESLLEP